MGRYWVVVHLQSGESVGRGCQIHPVITYEVIARNRRITRIWPRRGAEVSRAEGNPYPKLIKSTDWPTIFREVPTFTKKNEMRDKMSEF